MALMLPDEILLEILFWLPLQSKFIASRVSVQWKRVCLDLIRKQRCLLIARADGFRIKECQCVGEHAGHCFSKNDILVVETKFQMLKMMSAILVNCPSLVAVSIPGLHWIRYYDEASVLVRSIVEKYASQLECLNCSAFPASPDLELPSLVHLSLATGTDVETIFRTSPNLSAVQFNDLNRSFFFPKGLKAIKFMSEPNGLEQLFTSPATATLEVLSFRSSCNDSLESAVFFMPNLKTLLFHGGVVSEVLRDFLRSLQLSSELQELDLLSVMAGEDLPAAHWNNFFTSVPELRRLRISKPSINADVMRTLVQNCRNLREISLVDCLLDDQSLEQIGSLQKLTQLELTFNDLLFSPAGVLSLTRGACRPVLRKLLLYRCKGSFLSDDVREDVLQMQEQEKLSACKLIADNGSFELSHPAGYTTFPNFNTGG